MSNSSFSYWCRVATDQIGYGPDREAVKRELYAHMEDHYDALIAKGLSHVDATHATMDAMGKPEEIAPQLAALHKPFWGYVLRTCRILLVVLLLLGTVPIWKYFTSLDFSMQPFWEYDVCSPDSYGGDTGRTLLHISQPDTSFSSDGNTFRVTDAVLYKTVYESTGEPVTRLYFLIEQSSLIPWPVQDNQELFRSQSVAGWFHATDSLGNEYTGHYNASSSAPHIVAHTTRDGLFSCTTECWINDFPEDAQWIDIIYDRDGRSCALHIDLTGGDDA